LQSDLLGALVVPVIQGPMAGGPSTPELAAAVTNAGGLGFLAGGYKTTSALREQIDALRSRTGGTFGVNLFVPDPGQREPVGVDAYRQRLHKEAAELGVELGFAEWTDDEWESKLDLLRTQPVPVVSFTFGLPAAEIVAELKRVDTTVIATVTHPDEARQATEIGVDALCVQGTEAGGHQASFDDAEERTVPLLDLLPRIRAVSSLPLVGAGGITSATDVRAVLDAGAWAAQMGTAFLRADESGTNAAHKAALADPHFTQTALTRAFSGRLARGLVNEFLGAHTDAAPRAYPHVHYLTSPLRQAAIRAGDPERVNLWAGTSYRRIRQRPAADIIDEIAYGLDAL
jgi:nitronate monooxygenase